MLDGEDMEVNGLEGVEDPVQLATRLNDMSLREDDEEDGDEIGVDERVFEHVLTSGNPVFDPKRQSSKVFSHSFRSFQRIIFSSISLEKLLHPIFVSS